MSAHWGIPDPTASVGSQAVILQVLYDTYHMRQNRIANCCARPLVSIDRLSVQRKIENIGKMRRDPDAVGTVLGPTMRTVARSD